MNSIVIVLFCAGYVAILLEQYIRLNKSAIALITGAICWSIIAINTNNLPGVIEGLQLHMIDIGELMFFLLGAMTIVETIDMHDGFQNLASFIKSKRKLRIVALVSLISFFLSAILDNLTTTIVLISILNKIIDDKKTKWLLLSLVVISANAGGAWSPIGDITTTMLWIGGQISSWNIIHQTFLASFGSMFIAALLIYLKLEKQVPTKNLIIQNENFTINGVERNIVFFAGLLSLLFIPVFKSITGLPPFMGMLFCLGFMWLITGFIHRKKEAQDKGLLSVNHALHKIDVQSILFFTGILLCVAALEVTGSLHELSVFLDQKLQNPNMIATAIGILSAVFDNIPLVAGLQNMYSLQQYPIDHPFWELLAYCAGTGGSIFIIGSAAGVMVMGMEKMSFGWYLKNISWIALISFLTGILIFITQQQFS
jgi:Na+/H+ antiporter NhaD/arsenite permease-like protein